MKIRECLKILVEREGSDLYLKADAYPCARINGKVEPILTEKISTEEMEGIKDYLLTASGQNEKFKRSFDIDFMHIEPDVGRFRVDIFMQKGTPALVARHVRMTTKTFDELGLPDKLCKLFCEESKGMFLVCGPAGNGKSTTIASMIEYINTTNAKHIITIEDPIEFIFDDKKSIINQRDLKKDVASYPAALRSVTQQSPDIIYIGNIRDTATMQAAITATELGAFVMSTLHTINAVQTIVRIINFFPPYQHEEVRMQLSLILKGTFSLRLLPRKDGKGRILAYETMVVTPTISRLIREGKIKEIQKYIDEGDLFGMQSFKRSLVKLVKEGLVAEEEARSLADSKDEFDLEMKGLKS